MSIVFRMIADNGVITMGGKLARFWSVVADAHEQVNRLLS